MPTLYAPGTTPVAVTPQGFVVLGPDTPHTLVARIRALVSDGRGLGGVIEALTSAYGASLTAIPPFGVALAEGDAVRIAVRGDFAFDVEAVASERVTGAGVTTWTERLISGVVRVTFAPADGAPAELPVNDGVVLAAVVTWDAAPSRSSSAVADARPVPPAAEAEPEPVTAPEPASAQNSPVKAGAPDAEALGSDEPEPLPAPEPEPELEPAASGGGVAAPAPAVPALIDSNAVLSLTETLIPADSTFVGTDRGLDEPGPEAASAEDGSEPPKVDDEAWAATVVRRADASSPIPVPPPIPGDHDGETISLAQARALRAGAAGQAPPVPVPVSPFTSPLAPPRPPAPGRVRVSSGQVVMLDRTVVIGRRPRSTRVSGTDLPHLVAVDSPQQDISRSHVELRVEGESIVATDLRTTNGTTLLRTGSEPMRLHPGEGTVVVPGDVLDLGDGITVSIEAVS